MRITEGSHAKIFQLLHPAINVTSIVIMVSYKKSKLLRLQHENGPFHIIFFKVLINTS